jgi:hypothetical protein
MKKFEREHLMKSKLIKLLCIISLSLGFLTGCTSKQGLIFSTTTSASTTTAEYKITQFFGSADDMSEYIQDIKNAGRCESISATDNNTHIVVNATEEQRKIWVSTAENTIDETIHGIDASNHYSIECEDDYTKLIIAATKDWNTQQLALDMTLVLYNMEIHQIFSGKSSWGVDFIVMNSENQKILYEVQYPEKEIDFGDAIWENSNE